MPKPKVEHEVFSGVEKKKCPRCGFWKDLTHFGKNKAAWDGLTVCCKECQAITFKKFYDKQGVLLNRRPKVIPHRTVDGVECKRCSVCKTFRPLDFFHKLRSTPDGLYSQCKICKSEYTELYTVLNKEKVTQRLRVFYQENRERINVEKRQKYESNFSYRLNKVFSSSVYRALKGKKGGNSCIPYLDYTITQLRLHLSLQFEDWMTLDNYGREEGNWSIDHIDPVDSFNITSLDCDDFKRCWALENLRPLGHAENLRKGHKLLSVDERERAKKKALWAATIVRERESKCAVT